MCVEIQTETRKVLPLDKFQRENFFSRRAFNFLLFVFLVDLQYFEICQIAEDFLREILDFIVRQIPESFKVKCISLSKKNNAIRNVNPTKSETVGKHSEFFGCVSRALVACYVAVTL